MKKTISINISGVIFHIEEDGYEKLKSYLQSIQQYFSTYDDSQEIVTDIENRIAEKLLNNLKGDDKTPARQAVTLEDVNGLIAKMGTVADFEAVENDEVLVTGSSRAKTNPTPRPNAPEDVPGKEKTTNAPPPGTSYSYKSGKYEYAYQRDANTGKTQSSYGYNGRKLSRDLRHKTLGGVAAGLAHYFRIDPVWIRVLLVTLVIGFPALSNGLFNDGRLFGSLSGVTIIAYILLWAFLPGDATLEAEKGIRKFYRNPDNKVLGGVASGLAAYFGVEISIIRIAMVATVFIAGFGILAYIVLWMVAPEARSLTEKMEMTGKPITLSNIESSVKSNLNVAETAPESGLTQLLLFPFRAIAAIFSALGKLFGKTLGGLGSVIRILFGLLLMLVGFSLVIACLTVLGAGIGVLAGTNFGDGDGIPLSILREDASFITLLSGFTFGFLPSVALGLTGLIVITRKSFLTGNTVLTLLAIWVVSGVILASTVPQIVGEFNRRAKVETSLVLRPANTPTFALNDTDNDNEFRSRPRIELLGYNGTEIKVELEAAARGRNREQAEANAREIQYLPVARDSTMTFDDTYNLPDDVRFRNQELQVRVYIPYGKPFRMTEEFGEFISNQFDRKELNDMATKLWQFTPEGLNGVGFERTIDRDRDNDDRDDDEGNDDEVDVDVNGELTRSLLPASGTAIAPPTAVAISGNFGVRFQKGSTFKVEGSGSEEGLNRVTLTTEDGNLRVEQRENPEGNTDRIGLIITVPTLQVLRLSGRSEARLTEFDELSALTLDLSGESKAFVKTTAKSITTDQTGASSIVLRGKATQLQSTLSGASRLQATQSRVERADVNAAGASRARLGEVTNLSKKTTGNGQITQTKSRD
ncbi:PspC domain-containing protein [Fibrella aquatica]|uniref:PspC domain-containing protein n=1 Tax=Fibrella aquatica TaxID=3242487 RepID=UPI0035201C5A